LLLLLKKGDLGKAALVNYAERILRGMVAGRRPAFVIGPFPFFGFCGPGRLMGPFECFFDLATARLLLAKVYFLSFPSASPAFCRAGDDFDLGAGAPLAVIVFFASRVSLC
jgi:hypothetical protein